MLLCRRRGTPDLLLFCASSGWKEKFDSTPRPVV
jgi:hypothetical protein